ncbi:MAG: hypothetical protein PHT38_05500 [Halothiobacillus sp.]|nr:hypothetical protein [Halothiobacillus sp.]
MTSAKTAECGTTGGGQISTLFPPDSCSLLHAVLHLAASSTLDGPLSLYTFGWLTLVGLILLLSTSNFGRTRCDIEKKRPIRVFYFALPVCEAAIALGVVIGATLLGIAIASDMIASPGAELDKVSALFFGLSTYSFMLTYPVVYFSLSVIDSDRRIEKPLNISVAVYSLFVLYLFVAGSSFPSSIGIGVLGVTVISVYWALKRYVLEDNVRDRLG